MGIHQSRSRIFNPRYSEQCRPLMCTTWYTTLWIYWFCPFPSFTPIGWMMLEGELLKSGVSTTRGLWLCATVSLVTRRVVSNDSPVINSWMLVQDHTLQNNPHAQITQMSFELIRKDVPKFCNKSCAACDRSLLGDQMVGCICSEKDGFMIWQFIFWRARQQTWCCVKVFLTKFEVACAKDKEACGKMIWYAIDMRYVHL